MKGIRHGEIGYVLQNKKGGQAAAEARDADGADAGPDHGGVVSGESRRRAGERGEVEREEVGEGVEYEEEGGGGG